MNTVVAFIDLGGTPSVFEEEGALDSFCGISKSAALMDLRIAEFFGRIRVFAADVFFEEVGKSGNVLRSLRGGVWGGGGVGRSFRIRFCVLVCCNSM